MSIRDRILARRDLDGLRAARDITGLTDALNAEGLKAPQQRFITARAVMATCPGGVEVLGALQSASANPAVGWALKFLGQEAGLDIGDPFTQGMVDQLVAGNVLTAEQGAALKAMAMKPVIVDRLEVEAALYNRDTTEK